MNRRISAPDGHRGKWNIGEKNVDRILVGKPETDCLEGRLGTRWNGNVKMDI